MEVTEKFIAKMQHLSGKTKQYLAAIAGSFGFFAMSATYCWVTPVLALIASGTSPVRATPFQASGLAVLAELGQCFLALPIATLANRWGRKPLLMVAGPITTASWILIYMTNNIYVLLFMRFVQGVMLGIFMGVLPMYAAEISEPSVRGSMSSVASILWNVGFLYSNVIATVSSYDTLLLLTSLPAAVFPIIFFGFSETPHYYLYKGKEKEAMKSLESFRDQDHPIDLEMESIRNFISQEQEEKASPIGLLMSTKGRKALILMFVIDFQMGVIVSQITYLSQSSEYFHSGEYSTFIPTIIYGICALIISTFANVLADMYGRRLLVTLPCFFNSILLFVVGIYCYLEKSEAYVSDFWYIPICCNVLGLLFTNLGTPSAIRLYQTELFSIPTRSLACALVSIDIAVKSSLLTFFFQMAKASGNLGMAFFLFSALTMLSVIYSWYRAPETKGKTFEEIYHMI